MAMEKRGVIEPDEEPQPQQPPAGCKQAQSSFPEPENLPDRLIEKFRRPVPPRLPSRD